MRNFSLIDMKSGGRLQRNFGNYTLEDLMDIANDIEGDVIFWSEEFLDDLSDRTVLIGYRNFDDESKMEQAYMIS